MSDEENDSRNKNQQQSLKQFKSYEELVSNSE